MGFFANIIADSKGSVSYQARIKGSPMAGGVNDIQSFEFSSEATSAHDNLAPYTKATDTLNKRRNSYQITEKFGELPTEGSMEPESARSMTDITVYPTPHLPKDSAAKSTNGSPTPSEPEPNQSITGIATHPNPHLSQEAATTNKSNEGIIEELAAQSDIQAVKHSRTPDVKMMNKKEKNAGIERNTMSSQPNEKGFLYEIVNSLSEQSSSVQKSNHPGYQNDEVSATLKSANTPPNDDIKSRVNSIAPQPPTESEVKTAVKPHPSSTSATFLSQSTQPSRAEQQLAKPPQVHIGQLDIIVQAPPVNQDKSTPTVTMTSASRQYLRSL